MLFFVIVYICAIALGLFIQYLITKTAVKNAIIEAHNEIECRNFNNHSEIHNDKTDFDNN